MPDSPTLLELLEGWKTNAATHVQWHDLPTENRDLMIHVVKVVLYSLAHHTATSEPRKETP